MNGESKRIAYVCEACSSDRVTRDALAEWDTGNQEWVLGAPYDYAYYHDCEAEAHLNEIELPEEHD